jgi:hypothetical protein
MRVYVIAQGLQEERLVGLCYRGRQSQQSFLLSPSAQSLHVSARAGHLQVNVFFSCEASYCLLTDPLFGLYLHILSLIIMWSRGQSSWLQIQRPEFDSRHYQKKKVVGLERGPLSLVSTTEELLDRKVAAPV